MSRSIDSDDLIGGVNFGEVFTTPDAEPLQSAIGDTAFSGTLRIDTVDAWYFLKLRDKLPPDIEKQLLTGMLMVSGVVPEVTFSDVVTDPAHSDWGVLPRKAKDDKGRIQDAAHMYMGPVPAAEEDGVKKIDEGAVECLHAAIANCGITLIEVTEEHRQGIAVDLRRAS